MHRANRTASRLVSEVAPSCHISTIHGIGCTARLWYLLCCALHSTRPYPTNYSVPIAFFYGAAMKMNEQQQNVLITSQCRDTGPYRVRDDTKNATSYLSLFLYFIYTTFATLLSMIWQSATNVRFSHWNAISCDTLSVLFRLLFRYTHFRNRQIGNKITHRMCEHSFWYRNKSCDRMNFFPISFAFFSKWYCISRPNSFKCSQKW